MTTYQANIAAVEAVPFVELYYFEFMNESGYYTNYSENITFNNIVYLAVSITRTDFKIDANLGAVSVDITAGVLDTFGRYIATQPAARTSVKIMRAVSDTLSEFVVLFDGWVTGVSFNEKNTCNLKTVQKAGILDREVSMATHSAVCNHSVFYGDCRLGTGPYIVSPASFSFSGRTINAAEFAGFANQYFRGGEVHTTWDSRLITSHIGEQLTLHVPFDSSFTINTKIEVLPGCDRLLATCKSKFNNSANFLGFPFIPSKNPAVWGL
jgi:uncharacterized phage protein (TIGR02218 family)